MIREVNGEMERVKEVKTEFEAFMVSFVIVMALGLLYVWIAL